MEILKRVLPTNQAVSGWRGCLGSFGVVDTESSRNATFLYRRFIDRNAFMLRRENAILSNRLILGKKWSH